MFSRSLRIATTVANSSMIPENIIIRKKKWGRTGDVMKTPLSQVMGALRLCNPSANECLGNGPPSAKEDCPVFKR